MIEKILKRITKFYQLSFVLLITITLGSILYFWHLGFIDGTKNQELHKASFILENYTKKNQFKEVKDLIDDERPKDAIEKIKTLEKELELVQQLVSLKEFSILKEQIQDLKTQSAKIISYSKSEVVVSVFSKKLTTFYTYVKQNNWRTLTRMSQRINSKVSGHINTRKLDDLSKSVLRDFSSMVKITENSILSRKDKSEIISRISNLKIEMNMLDNYSKQRSLFYKEFAQVEKSLSLWLKKVSPEVTLEKIEVAQIGKTYVLGMLGILTMMSLMFIGSFIFNRFLFRKSQRDIETQFKAYLKDGVISGDTSLFNDYSEEFQRFSRKMSNYIEKRMSFGTIFQKALPLSSILLDENLKVVWANGQFCEDWQLAEEEIKKDYMSWDYLNKLTNIGNNDPVLEALKHNIAGIYQVQIKPNDLSDAKPFEMFVSPIKDKGETKIMIFFYDLTNLEETIKDQSISILNPVKSSVEKILNGNFVADEQVEYEFKVAGIEDVYEQFLSLNESIQLSENSFNGEINNLKVQIGHFEQTIADLEDLNSEALSFNRTNIDALKVFKPSVIGLSAVARKMEDLVTRSHELICTNVTAIKNSEHKILDLKHISNEFIGSLPRVNDLKEELKTTKNELNDNRSKLTHDLSQLDAIITKKSDINSIQRPFEKVKKSLSKVNQLSQDFEKKLSQFEIAMSKTQMIINSGRDKLDSINTDYESSQVTYSQKELAFIQKTRGHSLDDIEGLEQQVVESLKDIFTSSKSQHNVLGREIKLKIAHQSNYISDLNHTADH